MRSAGFRIGAAATGFLIFGAAVIHGPFGNSLIDASIRRSAQQALSDAKSGWAQLAVGQGAVILAGSAPDESALEAALSALAAGGVTRVDHTAVNINAPIVPIDDYRFTAQWRDRSLTLAGLAPGKAAREAILTPYASAASATVKDDTTTGYLEDEDSWVAATRAALHALSLLDTGSVIQQGRTLRISGVVSDAAIAEAAEGLIAGASGVFAFELSLQRRGSAPNASLVAGEDLQRDCQSAINRALNGRRLEFAPGSAELGVAQRALLDALAEQIRACGELTIEIEGHTDATGTQAGNLALSERRSIAVRDNLVQSEVSATLVIKAYGESRPIASNQTRTGQQRNRRIDFVVVGDSVNSDSQG